MTALHLAKPKWALLSAIKRAQIWILFAAASYLSELVIKTVKRSLAEFQTEIEWKFEAKLSKTEFAERAKLWLKSYFSYSTTCVAFYLKTSNFFAVAHSDFAAQSIKTNNHWLVSLNSLTSRLCVRELFGPNRCFPPPLFHYCYRRCCCCRRRSSLVWFPRRILAQNSPPAVYLLVRLLFLNISPSQHLSPLNPTSRTNNKSFQHLFELDVK